MPPAAIFLCAVAVVGWGASAIFDKIAMPYFSSPWSAVVFRLGVGWVFLALTGAGTGTLGEWLRVPFGALLALAISGILGAFIAQAAYYAAVKLTDVSIVVAVTATYPLVTFLLGATVLHEAVTAQKLAGVVLIVAGLALLTAARA